MSPSTEVYVVLHVLPDVLAVVPVLNVVCLALQAAVHRHATLCTLHTFTTRIVTNKTNSSADATPQMKLTDFSKMMKHRDIHVPHILIYSFTTKYQVHTYHIQLYTCLTASHLVS